MGIPVAASVSYQHYITFLVKVVDAHVPFQPVYPVNNQLPHHRMVREWPCYHQLKVLVSGHFGALPNSILQFHAWVQEIWHHSDKAGSTCHTEADSFSNKWRQYLK